MPAPEAVQQAASLLNQADNVTLLVGQGARDARSAALELAGEEAGGVVAGGVLDAGGVRGQGLDDHLSPGLAAAAAPGQLRDHRTLP